MWDKNITEIVKITENTKCLWRSILGYYDWNNEHYFEESLAWNIPKYPRWNNWYDWDTIFIPNWQNSTFAEMSPEEKQNYALTKPLYKQFNEFLNTD